MAIAWFDTEPLEMTEPVIRTGGLPLMKKGSQWPICDLHQKPMFFRAQLPFAVSSFGQFDDERLVVIFECHGEKHHCVEPLASSSKRVCKGGAVFIEEGELEIVEPPNSDVWDVVLGEIGAEPQKVRAWLEENSSLKQSTTDFALPFSSMVKKEIPLKEAKATLHELETLGAKARVVNANPLTLTSSYGGVLAPFTDEVDETKDENVIALPTLSILKSSLGEAELRGFLGGWIPPQSFDNIRCNNGHVMKTFVQLLAVPENEIGDPRLDSAIVKICKKGCSGEIFFPETQ